MLRYKPLINLRVLQPYYQRLMIFFFFCFLQCTQNFNFSASYEDNENHPDNKNQGNYPENKYVFKINNKKVLCSRTFCLSF